MSDPTPDWVGEHQTRIGFALELATVDTPSDPSGHIIRSGVLAEQLGFDAVFLPDHPSWLPECWIHLSALAMRTERLRLGTGVACVLYRHPVLLARLAADLDHLSGGRVILGIGAGWDQPEFARFGGAMPASAARQAALDEAVTILRGVWGAEPFSFAGRHFRTSGAHVLPAPVQQPHLPLLIAGGGERVTLGQVARWADACQLSDAPILSGGRTAADVRRKLEVLRGHCERAGRTFASILRTHFTGWLVLADSDAALRKRSAQYFPQGVERRFAGEWAGFAVVLTADQAVAYFAERAAAGIQYFVVQILDAADHETIHLLAEHVMPRVRGGASGA